MRVWDIHRVGHHELARHRLQVCKSCLLHITTMIINNSTTLEAYDAASLYVYT